MSSGGGGGGGGGGSYIYISPYKRWRVTGGLRSDSEQSGCQSADN